jgi:3-phenylpropionate/trans-cinnamate dioxygenase ferredoxin reductase component
MSDNRTFVIVGASLAGGRAAAELRERGFDGRVVLIGSEAELPYERPPLSKEYLRAEVERTKLLVREDGWWEDNNVELLLGRTVSAIDTNTRRVTLGDGATFEYNALLLTTGAEPRRLQVPGAELDGVYYLRTLADCDALRVRFDQGGQGGHVAVVGGGWIGSEVAASARQRGLEVTLIDPLELPNVRVFGREVAEFYRDTHAKHGVELMLGDGVDAFEGVGSVGRVRTSSGRTVDCDFVIIGVGVTPRVELAQAAGLKLDNGIVVDAQLRTSVSGVFAAGDVANAWHPFYERQMRLEHWSNALNQGPAAAGSMLGDQKPYERLPYFFSDQYDVGMEYSGDNGDAERVVFRGDRSGGEFVAFWLDGESRVVAGMNVNVWDVNEHVQNLIRSRNKVDPGALTDPDTPLETLTSSGQNG